MSTALPRLWLDAHGLGVRVLRNGDDPWQEPGEFGLFQRELKAWLSLEWVDIDLGQALRCRLAQRNESLRCVEDIEGLLDNHGLRAMIAEALAATAGALPGTPLALRLPGAGALAAMLPDGVDVDDDAMEDIAMAIVGLLRHIRHPGIACIAVEEPALDAVSLYAPLQNLAKHYDVPLVILLPEGAGDVAGFSKVYRHTASTHDGVILHDGIWTESAGVPGEDERPRFAHIPATLHPDEVLAGLSRLR